MMKKAESSGLDVIRRVDERVLSVDSGPRPVGDKMSVVGVDERHFVATKMY